MRFFPGPRLTALAFGFLCSAAAAAPVQFTYTSNPVDEAALDAHFEDWEAAWLKENVFGGFSTSWRSRAEVVLEVECDLSNGIYDCGSYSGYFVYSEITPNPVINDPRINDEMELLDISGFTDTIWMSSFAVGPTGEVTGWRVDGSEYGGYGGMGDFVLSHSGDRFGFQLFGGPSDIDLWLFYCNFRGLGIDLGNTQQNGGFICANGESAPTEIGSPLTLDLGVGTWSMSHMDPPGDDPLNPVPLPGGMPLILAGLAGLTLLRRMPQQPVA